jgi:hypothetical protein
MQGASDRRPVRLPVNQFFFFQQFAFKSLSHAAQNTHQHSLVGFLAF